MTPSDSCICAICREPITDPVGMWCFGCKHFVCEAHPGDPYGAHTLFDHDSTYWSEGDGDDEGDD